MHSIILNVLQSVSPEADFSKSKEFLVDGLIDSFDVVMITTALEEAFQISIPGEKITPENYASIEKLAALITECTESGTT